MQNHLLILTTAILFLLKTTALYSATEITGIITAKHGDSLTVEFKPNSAAAPKTGDKVDFSLQLEGIDVDAGQGEVIDIQANTVRVKTSDERPALKMKAVIHATGSGESIKPDSEYVKNRDRKRYVESANAACDRAKNGTGYIATDYDDDGKFHCMPNQATANTMCDELNTGSGWTAIRIYRNGNVECIPTQVLANAGCDRANNGTGNIATNIRADGSSDCWHFQNKANAECNRINIGTGYLATFFKDDGSFSCMPSQAAANMRCNEVNSGSGWTATNIRADGNFDCNHY